MRAIILQPYGLGDIIFMQTIAQDLIDQGYRVTWPVEGAYLSTLKHFPNVELVDRSSFKINFDEEPLILPYHINRFEPGHDDRITPFPSVTSEVDRMKSKYTLISKDWRTWKDNCKIIRDVEAERRLYFDVLGLEEEESYNLISEQFTAGGRRTTPVKVDNGLKNVYMTFIPQFTAIDWLLVMQRATTIHAVSSSCIYLFELFPMKAHEGNQIHLYVRRPCEQNHDNYNYLLSPTGYTLEP